MLNNLIAYITTENIYLTANWGVIPFWLLLIFAPNHGLTNFLTQSIIAPLLLAMGYSFLSYNLYLEKNIWVSQNSSRGPTEVPTKFQVDTFKNGETAENGL